MLTGTWNKQCHCECKQSACNRDSNEDQSNSVSSFRWSRFRFALTRQAISRASHQQRNHYVVSDPIHTARPPSAILMVGHLASRRPTMRERTLGGKEFR